MPFHEVGHLLAARALGLEVTALQLSFTGGFVEFADDDRLTAGRLALIAVAGPLVTACLALASEMALIVVEWPLSDSIERQTSADVVAERTLASLVIINGLALVINLLPFRSFDGGQLVNAILLWFARGR